jgi:site-specific DNA-methyltransferase (adenine-specific)
MNIIEKRLNEIIPYEKNPRKNDEAVKYVAESIKQFGFKVPIVIDKNNVIIAGHTRHKAAKKLNLKTAPCIIADDLTEEQIKAFRLADNKVSEMAEWDFGLLEEELGDIFDIDMEAFGFDLGEEEETEVVEDGFEARPPVEPKSKLGDIYQLGRHRLMCGDSTSITDVEKLMNGEKADMVFTDPPYGYNYQSNMREKSEKFDVIENDDKILDFFPNIQMVCNGFVFICTTWKVLDKWLPLFKKYHELSNMIIWNKGGGGIGDLKHTFSTDYEVILCANNGREITGKRIGSVWTIEKDGANTYVHPTQKPVKLAEFAIRNTTNMGDIVLDLFGGSGSTLMGCEQLKRSCYMMEYDPKYVDVIIERYEQFTGEKAVLLNG